MNALPGLPILTGLRELTPASRKFLLFTGLNLISWQCIVGQAQVLFGRALNMPPSWVGMVVSFMPLSMLLVIVSIPAVETYGPRRLLIVTWLVRNILAAAVFIIPLAGGLWGGKAAWYILLFAILCFSLVRAFGVGAWYPWLHELVPKHQLGTYFSVETVWVQTLTVIISFAIAAVLNMGDSLNRFYCVYAIGIMAGLISVLYIKKIPGGLRSQITYPPHRKFSGIIHALKQEKYRRFICFAGISMSSIMWINISSILYLRDILGFPDALIMGFTAVGAVGVALTARYWVRLAIRYGSYMSMAAVMTAYSVIAAGWCALSAGITGVFICALLLIILGAIFSAGFMIIASQSMMSLVEMENRVGYTSLWIIGTSISNGIPLVIAGWIIDLFHMTGYRMCFIISCGFGISVSFLWRRFRFDDEKKPMDDIHHIVRPIHPLRTLARVVWMILGSGKNER